jgi:DNA polymerase-3 subunit epsilon
MNDRNPNTMDHHFSENSKIAVVDIETTGFSHRSDCIVELGCCELELETGKTRKLFDELIREPHFSPKHKDAWIFNNSSLKYEDILEAESLESYREPIQSIFNKYPVAAYNKRFDFDYLVDRDFNIRELPCPMILATPILKLPPKIPGTVHKWPSVEEIWAYFYPKIDYVELHRGFDDSLHEALIISRLYELGHFKLNES